MKKKSLALRMKQWFNQLAIRLTEWKHQITFGRSSRRAPLRIVTPDEFAQSLEPFEVNGKTWRMELVSNPAIRIDEISQKKYTIVDAE